MLIGRAINIVLPILLTTIIVNIYSQSEFGWYRTIFTYLPLLQLVTLPGIDSVVLREGYNGKNVAVFSIFWAKVFCGLVGSQIILAVIILFDSFEVNTGVLLLVMMSPFLESAVFLKNRYYASGHSYFANVLTLRFILFRVCLIVVFVGTFLLMKLPLQFIMLAVVFSNSLLPLYLLISKKVFSLPGRSASWSVILMRIKQGFFYTLVGGMFTAVVSFDRIFVSFLKGPEFFAYYSILVMLPVEMARVIDIAIPSFYTYFLRFQFFKAKAIVIACAIFIVGVAGYSMTVRYLYPIVFGHNYSYEMPDIYLSVVLCVGLICDLASVHFINIYYGLRGLSLIHSISLLYVVFIGLMQYHSFDLPIFILSIVAKQIILFSLTLYFCKAAHESGSPRF